MPYTRRRPIDKCQDTHTLKKKKTAIATKKNEKRKKKEALGLQYTIQVADTPTVKKKKKERELQLNSHIQTRPARVYKTASTPPNVRNVCVLRFSNSAG